MTTETETHPGQGPESPLGQPAPAPVDWNAAPIRTLDAVEIEKTIPHRYPFLLVDKCHILEEKKRAVGLKGTTMNEHFFQGHFPGHPIMPGVLIVEALAQTACVLMLSGGGLDGKIAYFLGIENCKFRQPVKPGSLLRLQVEMVRMGGRAGRARGEAYVDGNLCTEVDLSFVLAPKS
ncbi:MAG: 3-hydroxyacyl-ACP dehydratase FabZ [Elusimicrobia bacterium]|nr:3-hydroxyacyl-ACP dehydratase FabZ [Elusimicrobiota bacterium]